MEQVIRACVIAASCTKGDVWPAMSPSQCIDGYALLDWPHSGYGFGPDRKMARRLLDCTRGPGCSALFVCYGGNWIYNSVCREGGGCNGAQIVHYKDPGTYFDCATIGATCVGLPTGAIRSCCTKKACGGTAETVCTSATRGTHCMLGIPFDFDCGPTGRICTTLPKQTLCKGTGAPCNVQAKPTCAGSVASYCSAGQLAKVDCAANPFRSACSALSVVHPPCAGAGKACNASFKGACKGDAIVVCVNGSMRNVSCASLGFSGCSTLSQGARCVP